MSKYLFFFIIGIILFILYNSNVDSFSIGAPVNQYYIVRYNDNSFRLITYGTIDEYITDLNTQRTNQDGDNVFPVQVYGNDMFDRFAMMGGYLQENDNNNNINIVFTPEEFKLLMGLTKLPVCAASRRPVLDRYLVRMILNINRRENLLNFFTNNNGYTRGDLLNPIDPNQMFLNNLLNDNTTRMNYISNEEFKIGEGILHPENSEGILHPENSDWRYLNQDVKTLLNQLGWTHELWDKGIQDPYFQHTLTEEEEAMLLSLNFTQQFINDFVNRQSNTEEGVPPETNPPETNPPEGDDDGL